MSATGSSRHGARRGRQRAAGFSLLELLLVIVLLGLLATLTVVPVQRGLAAAHRQAAVDALAIALRQTRLQALQSGQPADFWLDPARGRYQAGRAAVVTLPPGLQPQLRYAREVSIQAQPGEGVIRFYPDGSASGGRIQLQRGSRHWQLDVSWLSGHIDVHGD